MKIFKRLSFQGESVRKKTKDKTSRHSRTHSLQNHSSKSAFETITTVNRNTPEPTSLEESTFWQSNNTMLKTILTDEADSIEDMTQVSSQEYRFYHDSQRIRKEAEASVKAFQKGLETSHDTDLIILQQKNNQSVMKPATIKTTVANKSTGNLDSFGFPLLSTNHRVDSDETKSTQSSTLPKSSPYDDDDDTLFSFESSLLSEPAFSPLISSPSSTSGFGKSVPVSPLTIATETETTTGGTNTTTPTRNGLRQDNQRPSVHPLAGDEAAKSTCFEPIPEEETRRASLSSASTEGTGIQGNNSSRSTDPSDSSTPEVSSIDKPSPLKKPPRPTTNNTSSSREHNEVVSTYESLQERSAQSSHNTSSNSNSNSILRQENRDDGPPTVGSSTGLQSSIRSPDKPKSRRSISFTDPIIIENISHEGGESEFGAELSYEELPQGLPRTIMASSCCHMSLEDDDDLSIMTGWAKFQYHCESCFGPLCFDFWEQCDSDPSRKVVDEEDTLVTMDDELSYEDEGNVDVGVAIQATVLGSDYPSALEMPKRNLSYVWGNNFVGVVKPPSKKGNTTHSRRFPPGARVASISAWSAKSKAPAVVCNTSHLLPVRPVGGTDLDATEVSILVAAYLPAFQALHHGQRKRRDLAYKPTAMEGQRVLILTHVDENKTDETISSHVNNPFHPTLIDAQVQAAVRIALMQGVRDIHVTIPCSVSPEKRYILFGNDYRVRYLDTPAEDWIPMLRRRIDLVLDFSGQKTVPVAAEVLSKQGRYVGCLGEECCSSAIDCREEGPTKQSRKTSWLDSLAFWKCNSAILPEGRDVARTLDWTTQCMQLNRASLFDFFSSVKEDRRMAEHDFAFLLALLARRQIRPYVDRFLDVGEFPPVNARPGRDSVKFRSTVTGAVVCEPWSPYRDSDDFSCCSDLN